MRAGLRRTNLSIKPRYQERSPWLISCPSVSACGPFDVEIPSPFEPGQVQDRVVDVRGRRLAQEVGEDLHRYVMARNHLIGYFAWLGVLRHGLASDGTRTLFKLVFAFSQGQGIDSHGLVFIMDDELETIRQQRPKHQLCRVMRCGGRSFGDDVESVRLQPTGAAEDSFRFHS